MAYQTNLAARAAAVKRDRSVEPEDVVDMSTAQFINLCTLDDFRDLLANDSFLLALMIFANDHAVLKDEEFVAFAGLEMARACIIAGIGLHSLIETAATPAHRVWVGHGASESMTVDYRTLSFPTGQNLKTFGWNYFKHLRKDFDLRNIGMSSAACCRALIEGLSPESLTPVIAYVVSSVVTQATAAADARAATLAPEAVQSFVKVRNPSVHCT